MTARCCRLSERIAPAVERPRLGAEREARDREIVAGQAEGRIAAEQFIPSDTGNPGFDAQFFPGPTYEEGVEAVNCGLIHAIKKRIESLHETFRRDDVAMQWALERR